MATKLYIAKRILEETEKPDRILYFAWQRKDHGRWFADVGEGENRVRIEIGTTMRPPLVDIKLSSPGSGEIHVQEPVRKMLSNKYDSEEDEELAKVMKRLIVVVMGRHAEREEREMQNEEERTQRIYQRLISGLNH